MTTFDLEELSASDLRHLAAIKQAREDREFGLESGDPDWDEVRARFEDHAWMALPWDDPEKMAGVPYKIALGLFVRPDLRPVR